MWGLRYLIHAMVFSFYLCVCLFVFFFSGPPEGSHLELTGCGENTLSHHPPSRMLSFGGHGA